MRFLVTPGGTVRGAATVPGDKSIAHRWLILAATARGRSRILGLPPGLDVLATARGLASVVPAARPGLEVWASNVAAFLKGGGSTWNAADEGSSSATLEVEGEGRSALSATLGTIDCANSGTTMRLFAGLLAPAPFRSELVGDSSLSRRPMERVADPLRSMGAAIETTAGRPPVRIDGRPLHGADLDLPVPSAQVKSAVLLAGIAAEGTTRVREPAATRDHTERALTALGAPVELVDGGVTLRRFQHEGFAAQVPGDVSSAVFLIGAAALTGGIVTIERVGLNPSRTRALEVLRRMGVRVETEVEGEELGEPVGRIVAEGGQLMPVRVGPEELPLLHDEVPVLAVLAAQAPGDSWFAGAGELRVKESDRLAGITEGIRALGGVAATEGDDLVVGGGGLDGGAADAFGDHRLSMAFAVAGLAAAGPIEVRGAEAADVSFPGFAETLRSLGAAIEVER